MPYFSMGFFDDEITELKERGLYRSLRRLPPGVLNFCSNDYLGLAADPRLAEAAAEAAKRYGAGSGAARLISGNNPLGEELEAALADLKGTEAALLFNSGYHTEARAVAARTVELFRDAEHVVVPSGSAGVRPAPFHSTATMMMARTAAAPMTISRRMTSGPSKHEARLFQRFTGAKVQRGNFVLKQRELRDRTRASSRAARFRERVVGSLASRRKGRSMCATVDAITKIHRETRHVGP